MKKLEVGFAKTLKRANTIIVSHSFLRIPDYAIEL
jgi:hypothetical protein